MTLLQTLSLGIVQGLAEFLPVSSSAHLILVPWLFNWPSPGLAYDVSLHWGTLIAVLVYFRKDLLDMLIGWKDSFSGSRDFPNKLPWFIIAATVPGAIIGYVFEHQAETVFRSPLLIAGTLSGLGVLLLFADRATLMRRKLETLTFAQALLIGVFQGLAIVPGISRSGITMSVALLMGLERPAAVKFSFLLSIPIIAGAGVLKIRYLMENLTSPIFLMGVGTAALSGYMAIYFLMNFVKTNRFTPFAIYRFALSGIILAMVWLRG